MPSVRLLTNNPLKIESLQAYGIAVAARVPLPPRVTAENATYLLTKVLRMSHLLSLDAFAGVLPGGANGVNPKPPHSSAPTTRARGRSLQARSKRRGADVRWRRQAGGLWALMRALAALEQKVAGSSPTHRPSLCHLKLRTKCGRFHRGPSWSAVGASAVLCL